MMRALALVLALGACTKATSSSEPAPQPPAPAVAPAPTPAPTPAPAAPATVGKVTVVMTAATLADDCGGAPPWGPPTAQVDPPKEQPAKAQRDPAPRGIQKPGYELADVDAPKSKAKMERRRCEQTSMQLAVTSAGGGAPTKLAVKKVELFDASGKSLGELVPSKPTRWTDKSMYEAWDEQVPPDQKLSVSYVLSQPAWDNVPDRMNKTYTVKATVTVGGSDQTVGKDVEVRMPTSLPPGVKT